MHSDHVFFLIKKLVHPHFQVFNSDYEECLEQMELRNLLIESAGQNEEFCESFLLSANPKGELSFITY